MDIAVVIECEGERCIVEVVAELLAERAKNA